MHSSQWNSLRSSLIQGGVPLWRAQRAIAELREHYLDLEAEALDAGLCGGGCTQTHDECHLQRLHLLSLVMETMRISRKKCNK